MGSTLRLIVLLGLSGALLMGADSYAYAPTLAAESTIKEDFYLALDSAKRKTPASDKLILMGAPCQSGHGAPGIRSSRSGTNGNAVDPLPNPEASLIFGNDGQLTVCVERDAAEKVGTSVFGHDGGKRFKHCVQNFQSAAKTKDEINVQKSLTNIGEKPKETQHEDWRTLFWRAKKEMQDRCLGRCPAGWARYKERCYRFINNNKKSWCDAEAFCIMEGGNLFSLHTAEDANFVRDVVRNSTGTSTRTWLGSHDAVKNGCWMNCDGSKFDFKAWGPGEPNNYRRRESCMQMRNRVSQPIGDAACKLKAAFICGRAAEGQND